MRFVSFNANGIRARLHQLRAIRESHDPDVLALQETKVADEQFPFEDVRALGFEHIQIFGQKPIGVIDVFAAVSLPALRQAGSPERAGRLSRDRWGRGLPWSRALLQRPLRCGPKCQLCPETNWRG